jgi:hypothetical protein
VNLNNVSIALVVKFLENLEGFFLIIEVFIKIIIRVELFKKICDFFRIINPIFRNVFVESRKTIKWKVKPFAAILYPGTVLTGGKSRTGAHEGGIDFIVVNKAILERGRHDDQEVFQFWFIINRLSGEKRERTDILFSL